MSTLKIEKKTWCEPRVGIAAMMIVPARFNGAGSAKARSDFTPAFDPKSTAPARTHAD